MCLFNYNVDVTNKLGEKRKRDGEKQRSIERRQLNKRENRQTETKKEYVREERERAGEGVGVGAGKGWGTYHFQYVG